MCCFSIASAPVRLFGLFRRAPKLEVSNTRIFARLDGATQYLAYSMSLAVSSDVAMVLPLPVARRADDALTFVDLSAAPDLFDRLDELFVLSAPQGIGAAKSRSLLSLSLPKLEVHRVGSFDASYVPSLADMSRLDERFRIPDEVWHQRPDYASFGFAVFKLRKGANKTIHPMGMRFDTREPRSIFFPTVHVHDGAMHERARFDHALTYQTTATSTEGRPAPRPVPWGLVEKSSGVLAHDVRTYRIDIHGEQPNVDTRVAI